MENKFIRTKKMNAYAGFLYILIVMLCAALPSPAQQRVSISGKVFDLQGQALPGVSISLHHLPNRSTTNAQGEFTLLLPAWGTYQVKLNSIGFEPLEKEIVVSAAQRSFDFVLQETVNQLANVTITAKSETQKLKEQAIKTTVIDMQEAYAKPSTVTELMNRTSGVRIRQTGGLGAAADVSLNGFQGKSIKYFKDGIPLDYLGDAYGLSALPANMLQRIEVYKGVLPVTLGADALGGAVNMISRRPAGRYLETGYELASFNTHRLHLNSYYSDSAQTWFAGADAFYNHSDNHYKALVKATDPDTRNQYDARVPLFHNAYTGYFVQGYTGVKNRDWADELKLEISTFHNNREQQHPALMTDAYGAVTSKQSSLIPSVLYRKAFFAGRLTLQQFVAYSRLTLNRIDTLHGQYDWFGHFTPNPYKVGESRQPSLSDIENRYFVSRTNIAFALNENHKLEFNTVYTDASRQGHDPLGPRFSGTTIDILTARSAYRKWVGALGLSSDFQDRRWNHVLMAKFFHYSSKGIEAYEARPVFSSEVKTVYGRSFGLADALKYEISSRSMLRLSAEYATRLPDQNELFGDAVFIVPNFSLKPERSLNVNLGYRYNQALKGTFEMNTFYRRTQNMILLVPVQAPYARFENQENVRGYGIELDGTLYPVKKLRVNANVTWQNLRLFDVSITNGGADKNDARLRNTPYLFANSGINYSLSRFNLYGYYSFVRAYYLETIPKRLEPGGFLGLGGKAAVNSLLIIPDQHLLSAGAGYSPAANRLTLHAEVKNLLNNDLYDNYRIQKAGRSFHVKINYIIK